MNAGLYDWAQKQSPIVDYYMKGGTGKDPSDGTQMLPESPLGDVKPGTTDWIIKPVEGTTYYTIQAKGSFKYSYLNMFTDEDDNSWINVTDKIRDESQWTITKNKDSYIIKNKVDNIQSDGNYNYLCNNVSTPTYAGLCKGFNGPLSQWFVTSV